MNYNIHDKEMGAIMLAFEKWEHALKSCQSEITVYNDHNNLWYFIFSKQLMQRQARWATFLGEFYFAGVYRKGNKNGTPDALLRRWDHRSEKGSKAQQPITSLFKLNQLRLAAVRVVKMKNHFVKMVKKAGNKDEKWTKRRLAVKKGNTITDSKWGLENSLLLWKSQWFVPKNKDLCLKILHVNHDSRVAGHFGIHKTLERIKANYHWTNLGNDVPDYVRSCNTCQRDKASRHQKYGILKRLEAPCGPWSSISMDWIVKLPGLNGFTQIWVVVD